MVRMVFVCTGNICRSPMAEGVMRHEWKQRGKDGLVVSSMGIHGLDQQGPSPFAQEVCLEHGVDISSHLSRKLVIPELESADIIFSMERVHKDFLNLFLPKFEEKNVLFAAWPGKESRKSNVRDPMGASKRVYKQVYDLIAEHVDRVIPLIEEYYY